MLAFENGRVGIYLRNGSLHRLLDLCQSMEGSQANVSFEGCFGWDLCLDLQTYLVQATTRILYGSRLHCRPNGIVMTFLLLGVRVGFIKFGLNVGLSIKMHGSVHQSILEKFDRVDSIVR